MWYGSGLAIILHYQTFLNFIPILILFIVNFRGNKNNDVSGFHYSNVSRSGSGFQQKGDAWYGSVDIRYKEQPPASVVSQDDSYQHLLGSIEGDTNVESLAESLSTADLSSVTESQPRGQVRPSVVERLERARARSRMAARFEY